MARQANRLIDELGECQRRHQALQHKLLSARADFRDALTAQLATPPNPPTQIDLERQLLRPLLELPLAAADVIGTTVVAASGAPVAPPAVDLERLVAAMSMPPAVRDGLGDEVDDVADLTEEARKPRFPDTVWDLVDSLLADVARPTRLSALLARVGQVELDDPPDLDAVAHLLVLRAARGLDPALAEHLRDVERAPFLVSVADGTLLELLSVAGPDLLVVPAELATSGVDDGGR